MNHPCEGPKKRAASEIGARGLTPLSVRQPLRGNQGVADDLRTSTATAPCHVEAVEAVEAVELRTSGPSQNCRR